MTPPDETSVPTPAFASPRFISLAFVGVVAGTTPATTNPGFLVKSTTPD